MALDRVLYGLLRALRDAKAVSTGKVGQRAKNRLVGRSLAGSSWWRRLWR